MKLKDDGNEFVSFKKVIIFGAKGTGKTTLSEMIETGKFSNESPTEESKNLIYNEIFYYRI